jgi:hypothetical protein
MPKPHSSAYRKLVGRSSHVTERVNALEDPIAVRLIPRFGGDLAAGFAAPSIGGFKIINPKPEPSAPVRRVVFA